MFWLSALQPTVREMDQNRDNVPKSGGPIELDRVRFSYPLRPDAVVLRGVDMEVSARKEWGFVPRLTRAD
jgi:ATP-binding cassette subfamily B (MDR/TAP) protein 1